MPDKSLAWVKEVEIDDLLDKDTAVGKFLYESGYTGRSTTAKVKEIIDKAKAIRKKRN